MSFFGLPRTSAALSPRFLHCPLTAGARVSLVRATSPHLAHRPADPALRRGQPVAATRLYSTRTGAAAGNLPFRRGCGTMAPVLAPNLMHGLREGSTVNEWWQVSRFRRSSAAKGMMGARPQESEFYAA